VRALAKKHGDRAMEADAAKVEKALDAVYNQALGLLDGIERLFITAL
jgi:hypothetical protein